MTKLENSKSQTRILKQFQTVTNEHVNTGQEVRHETKLYDLEDRTFDFAKDVRVFCKQIPKSLANHEDIKQLVRASGSVGANYIEANESLSKKDFLMRVKICRKEARKAVIGCG